MAALRTKFLQRAMHYIGTPYARKYHDPDCELAMCMQNLIMMPILFL